MKNVALAALIYTLIGAGVADAAIISRTFTAKAIFTDGGPISTINFDFGISYDPDRITAGYGRDLDYFKSDSSEKQFDPALMKFGMDSGSYSNTYSITIHANASGLAYSEPDSQMRFEFITDKPEVLINFWAFYTVGDGQIHVSTNSNLNSIVETTPVSVVPEPTTWATMLAGFALVGGAMRVRRRRVVMAV